MISTAAASPDLQIVIDLGSARTLVHCRVRGLWVDEPTVVARDDFGRPVQAHDDEGFAVAAGLQRVPRSLGARHGAGRSDLTGPSVRYHPIVAKRGGAARR